jgi:DNA damage-binding protein 1
MGDSQLLRIESTPVGNFGSPTLPIPPDVKAFPASRIFFPTGKSKSIADELEGKKGCIIDNKGSYVTVLQTFKNLAPIADAVLVDSDGNGQVSPGRQ